MLSHRRHGLYCYMFSLLIVTFIGYSQETELCIYDNFNAECPNGNVIEIQNATYGRMEVGKCIKEHLRMGCAKDVVRIVDRLCGGKQTCQFKVFIGLESVRPCQDGLTAYLEATYTCVPVTSFADNTCTSQAVKLTNGITSHLSKDANTNSNTCVSPKWRFATEPGQSIEITLLDYTDDEQQNQSPCSPLGYIYENVVRTNKTICSIPNAKHSIVYKSVGFSVDIAMLPEEQRSSKGIFVLKYKVIGCPDVPVMNSVYYTREGAVAVLGCSEDELVWTLNCENNRWTGKHKNCSESGVKVNGGDSESEILSFLQRLPEGVTLAIIIGTAVLLSIMVLVCGFMYIASRRSSHPETVSETYSHGPRRTDSEFKMYAGPTLRKSQECLDSKTPVMYHNTMDPKLQNETLREQNMESCSCASYSSIPKLLENDIHSKSEEVYLDPMSHN